LVVADRWFPSSKTCSDCGAAKAKLRIQDRVFRRENTACGLVVDRDVNAIHDLANLTKGIGMGAGVAGSGFERTGADRKPTPVGRGLGSVHPRRACADQTGTARGKGGLPEIH
jgi:putative transposase